MRFAALGINFEMRFVAILVESLRPLDNLGLRLLHTWGSWPIFKR